MEDPNTHSSVNSKELNLSFILASRSTSRTCNGVEKAVSGLDKQFLVCVASLRGTRAQLERVVS
jgi:hypothetical protein